MKSKKSLKFKKISIVILDVFYYTVIVFTVKEERKQ